MATHHRKSSAGVIRVGISGWTYTPWRKTFYPKDLAQKNELAYASAMLPSIEINGTFYSLQRPKSYATWYEQTPEGFVFSVKANRFITHIRRLRDVQAPIANFMLSGLLRLNEKLGPILWQCPPNLQFDAKVVEIFLSQLPRSTKEAVQLKKQTDSRMKGRLWAETDADRPIRHAMEIRHSSFENESFIRLLRKHNVAVVVADTAGKWPMLHDVTADFVYARLHGAEELYASGYTDAALKKWATKIKAWSTGKDAPGGGRVGPAAKKRSKRDVFVYFDNDVKVRAPFDAAQLLTKLGLRDQPLLEGSTLKSKEVPRRQWPAI